MHQTVLCEGHSNRLVSQEFSWHVLRLRRGLLHEHVPGAPAPLDYPLSVWCGFFPPIVGRFLSNMLPLMGLELMPKHAKIALVQPSSQVTVGFSLHWAGLHVHREDYKKN